MSDSVFLPAERVFSVWSRNALVWRKSALRSLLGTFSDPLLYLLALGYGLGRFIGEVDGLNYVVFLCSGIIASSAMNAATFEGLYMAYTRMETNKTWEGILSTAIGLPEVVFGEILWMGTKSVISVTAILSVALLLGLVQSWMAVLVIPVGFLCGICFGAMAMVVTSYSRSYEFFLYYVTLLVTPMILLSGVFFPLSSLPDGVRLASAALPLQHVVIMVRALMTGSMELVDLVHLLVPLLFLLVAGFIALGQFRKRLQN
ncbi:MAG: ABC transporter permease [Methylococcales bacterium]|jgi:lipooligosaccharide transport system permease protein|nr:ABC transporter permease [Methylococcales bacterium]MEE2766150.1 ABC transporter permease [Pseudomonadota bacterium]